MVQDQNAKFMYGWLMVASITFLLLFNFYFIFKQIFIVIKAYILLALSFFNRFYEEYFQKQKEEKKV
jgi:hypothetical protein